MVDGARVRYNDFSFYVYVESDEHGGLVSTLAGNCGVFRRGNLSAEGATAVRAHVDAAFDVAAEDEPPRPLSYWSCDLLRWRPGHAELRRVFDQSTSAAAQATRDACQALVDVSGFRGERYQLELSGPDGELPNEPPTPPDQRGR